MTFERTMERFTLRWVLGAVSAALIAVHLSAQVPVVECPIHNVPSQFTGQVKKDGEGRPVECQYTHPGHTFWARCQ
jgi:hypothetical protein